MGRLAYLTGLVCLLLSGLADPAAAKLEEIPAPGPKWGLPPKNERARRELSLPEHAGWQRAFSSVPSATDIGYSEGRIFVLAGSFLQAISADNGSVLWELETVGSDNKGMLLGTGGVIYFNINSSILAVDSSTGRLLWEKPEAQALNAGEERIFAWVAGLGQGHAQSRGRIVILDSANGAELASLHEGPADSYCHQAEGRSASDMPTAAHYALQIGREVICFAEDGAAWRSSVENQDAATQLVETKTGLLVAEYPLYSLRDKRLESEGYRENEGPRGLSAKIPNYVSLRLLAWNDGRELWRSRFDSGGEGGFWWNPFTVSDEVICVSDEVWISEPELVTKKHLLHFIKLGDGQRLTSTHEQTKLTGFFIGMKFVAPERLQFIDRDTRKPSLLDLSSGELWNIGTPTDFQWFEPLFVPEGLMLAGRTNSRQAVYAANPDVLVLMKLNDHMQPVSGQPQRHDFPQVDDTSLRAFIASADPQADPDLMRSIIGQGSTALVMLMDSFSELSEAQRDALLELCTYFDSFTEQNQSSSFPAVQYLVGIPGFIPGFLHRNANQELAPQLIRWVESGRFDYYKPDLVTAIALCGGRDAKAFLDNYYRGYEDQELKPMEPPFNPYSAGEAPGRGSALPVPGTAGGVAYADRLHGLTGCSVFIMFDSDGDGWFEELLPTGIVSLSNNEFFPTADIDPQRPRLLRLSEDEVEISFFREAVGPEDQYFVSDENHRLLHTRSARATLLLEDLRRDSDRDGLTDISEQEMFIDPQQADSDGDGLSDGADALPNVGTMGRLERGLARCLFWRGKGFGVLPASAIPTDCCYLLVSGIGGRSAFRMPGSRYTICLNTEEERLSFLAKQSKSQSNAVSIEVREVERGAPIDLPEYYLSTMRHRGEPLPVNLGDVRINLSTGHWSHSFDLVDIDGELYPAGYSNPPY